MRSASLVVAVILAVVIALICATVIATHSLSARSGDRWFIERKLEDNAMSGIAILLRHSQRFSGERSDTIDLFGDGSDLVRSFTYRWGGYLVGVSQAFHGDLLRARTGFIGSPYGDDGFCFWMLDGGRPLAVAGRTRLVGGVFLPHSGLKRVVIDGARSAPGPVLFGPQHVSDKVWPAPDPAELEYYKSVVSGEAFAEAEHVLFAQLGRDTVERSFTESPLVIKVRMNDRVERLKATGRVVLWSTDPLTIGKDVDIDGILIVAPTIDVAPSARIHAQLIASKAITIGEQARLAYPSALILVASDGDSSKVTLSSGSCLDGDVRVYAGSLNGRTASSIFLRKESLVVGAVNTPGIVELHGQVHGSVVCGGTVLHARSAVYEDHLLDAVVDRTRRPPGQVGCFRDMGTNAAVVVQWHQ